MKTILEAVYENGVLKLLGDSDLEEHQRYRVIVEALREPAPPHDPQLAAELARRTMIMPDGRRAINLMGMFDRGEPGPSYEEIEAVLDESRQEMYTEWDQLYGPEQFE